MVGNNQSLSGGFCSEQGKGRALLCRCLRALQIPPVSGKMPDRGRQRRKRGLQPRLRVCMRCRLPERHGPRVKQSSLPRRNVELCWRESRRESRREWPVTAWFQNSIKHTEITQSREQGWKAADTSKEDMHCSSESTIITGFSGLRHRSLRIYMARHHLSCLRGSDSSLCWR